MKKILITGGAGFIGCNLVRKALDLSFKVTNIDLLSYASNENNNNDCKNHSEYNFIKADIRDRKIIEEIIFSERPDYIMNLAAESHVDNSINSPDSFIETNIFGTYNLLEASRKYYLHNKSKTFIFHHISTDEVFGSLGEKGSFNENSPYKPRSPYSASKASSDHLVKAWQNTFNPPTLVTNCSNNYGPFQHPEKFIPLIITNILRDREIPIYGDGNNIRDWLHVNDHCDALLKILLNGKLGESYNIGSENELKNIDLVNLICQLMQEIKPSTKNYKNLIKFVKDRPGHDERYAINPRKIKKEVGWSPKILFNQGLKETIHWYIENKDWWMPLIKV